MHIISIRRIRICLLLVFFLIVCAFLTGCAGYDRYKGLRPTDYCPSVWICSGYDMTLTVSEKGASSIQIGDKKYDGWFDPGYYFEINRYNSDLKAYEDPIFLGVCKFSKETLTMTIKKDDMPQ